MDRRAQAGAVVIATLGLAACSGAIESAGTRAPGDKPTPGHATPPVTGPGPTMPGDKPPTGDPLPGMLPPPAAGAGRLRLLTRAQLETSLRDLLGDVPVGTTEGDDVEGGFA